MGRLYFSVLKRLNYSAVVTREFFRLIATVTSGIFK